jgi:glucan phosphoethanolaminetransferase (alkaline phosphatase superfamily)
MVHWGCWFQQRFGIPCPTCGMTRSVLLTLHGQFNEAVRLNPAGLMLVVGVVLLGLALLFLMFYQQRSTRLAAGAVHRYIRIGTSVYGGLLVVALFAHWLGEIALR